MNQGIREGGGEKVASKASSRKRKTEGVYRGKEKGDPFYYQGKIDRKGENAAPHNYL